MNIVIEGWQAASGFVVAAFTSGALWGRVVKKKELYREDGSQIYMTAEDCEESQARCSDNVCGTLDEVKATMKDMQNKDEIRDETMTDVRLFLAELKGKMAKDGP